MADFAFPLPVTQAALYHAALTVREAWIEAAVAGGVPAAYIRGLSQTRSIVYPVDGDELAALVVNVDPSARRIEEGAPAYHLPSVIHWPSPKTRRSRRGTYYLVIPFRHGTPGTQHQPMPRRVYAVAKQLQGGQRLTAGPSQGQARHAPGLSPYAPRNPLNVRPGSTPASIYEGLRRVPLARGRGSSYLTFRTMTPQSPGWHMPATAGKHIVQAVQAQMTPVVRQILEAAVRADVQAYLQASSVV